MTSARNNGSRLAREQRLRWKVRSHARALGAGVLVVLICAGCAAARSRRPTEALSLAFASDDAKRARAAAPDLYARAERAQQDARHARGDSERADHETRARLLLEAAIAEADRIAAERGAAEAEARAARALERRAELEQRRIALEQAVTREASARNARTEAEHAFQQVDLDQQKRGETPAQRETIRAQAAELLRGRARLTLAAASALGLSPAQSAAIEQTIARAEHAGAGLALLSAARAALVESERALGDARKALGAPRSAQTASLLEMGAERGLAPQASARGVAVALDAMFAASSAEPTRAGRARLEQIAALASAYPSGAIAIEGLRAPTAQAAVQQLARARATRIKSELAKATDAARLELAQAPTDDHGRDHPQVVFSAYLAEPSANDPDVGGH
jgi:hypothetical protein